MNYCEMMKDGIALLPIKPSEKKPMVYTYDHYDSKIYQGKSAKQNDPNPTPGFRGWCTDTSRLEMTKAWGVRPKNGGWLVLDVDMKGEKNGIEALKELFKDNPAATDFLTQITTDTFPAWVKSPSGGFHFYFKYTGDDIPHFFIAAGVEVFHCGGYVLAPGSMKPDGREYKFLGDMKNAPAVPAYLLDEIKTQLEAKSKAKACKYSGRAGDKGKRTPGFCPEFTWNDIYKAVKAGTIGMDTALFIYSEKAADCIWSYEGKDTAIDFIREICFKPHPLRSLLGWELTPENDPFYMFTITEDMTSEEKTETGKKRKEVEKAITEKEKNLLKANELSGKVARWVYDTNTGTYFCQGMEKFRHTEAAFSKVFAPVCGLNAVRLLVHNYNMIQLIHGTIYRPAKHDTTKPEDLTRFISFGSDDNTVILYNTYQPPKWQPTESARGYSAFLELAEHLFTEKKEMEHVLNMMAWMLQNPGKKIMTAVLLVGEAGGSGKTTFLESFERLWGVKDHNGITLNVRRVNNRVLEDTFQGIYEEACLIHIEELKMTDRLEFVNQMKDMITSSEMPMRKMRQDAFMTKNYLNFVASTNYEDALFLEKENDRRWYMATCHSEPATQRIIDTFSKAKEADDLEFYASIYTQLLKRDTKEISESLGKENSTPAKSIMFEKSRTRTDRKVQLVIEQYFPDTELVCAEDVVNEIMKQTALDRDNKVVEINPGLVDEALKKNGYTQHGCKEPAEKRIRFKAKNGRQTNRHRVFIHPSAKDKYNAMTWEEFRNAVQGFYDKSETATLDSSNVVPIRAAAVRRAGVQL